MLEDQKNIADLFLRPESDQPVLVLHGFGEMRPIRDGKLGRHQTFDFP